MVQLRRSSLVFVLALGDVVFALSNSSLAEVANSLAPANASTLLVRRSTGRMRVDQWLALKRKQGNYSENYRRHEPVVPRSTSSDSKSAKSQKNTDNDGELVLSSSSAVDYASSEYLDSGGVPIPRPNKLIPLSTEERKGWRKWHRKCTPCPDVVMVRWKNPTLTWVCGAYQRARRSFKNDCMMRLRNCQDGTMFVKIHDHRCQDDETGRFGTHFFYEYYVRSTGESESKPETTYEESSDSYDEARRFLVRRAGVVLGKIQPRRRVHVVANGTLNSSAAIDLRNFSSNTTTKNVNISLTEFVNTTSKIRSTYSSKVRNDTEARIGGNDTRAYYSNKDVGGFATRFRHATRRAIVRTVTRRKHNRGMANAIRAVSNFGLSLAKFTAHYGRNGHTHLADQPSNAQTNKQYLVGNHHMKTTSPNRTMNTGSSLVKFTAHYGRVGHSQLADQPSKAQTNKQYLVENDHMKTTSPNRSMSIGSSLAKFTAHYGSVGHSQFADQPSKAQTNKQYLVENHHMKTTSPNRTMNTPSPVILQSPQQPALLVTLKTN